MRRRWIMIPVLAVALATGACSSTREAATTPPPTTAKSATPTTPSPTMSPTPTPSPTPSPTPPAPIPAQLPQGGVKIFPAYRVVAYYGSAGTKSLGVLGEASPDAIMPRLRAAAAGFASKDRKVQLAYELIVTVAQAGPGSDGKYRRTISADKIKLYVEAARRNKVLLILDVQPGRSDFLTEVRKLEPYLIEPHVSLALDPEWRMAPNEVPGKKIGSVSAAEVNAVSAYLSGIVTQRKLPEKILILHQFRASMIKDIGKVAARPGLALVQHVDGFGSRSAKDATFAALRRPQQFHIGYKLFYDEDVNIYKPAEVLKFRPTPEYISYQ